MRGLSVSEGIWKAPCHFSPFFNSHVLVHSLDMQSVVEFKMDSVHIGRSLVCNYRLDAYSFRICSITIYKILSQHS